MVLLRNGYQLVKKRMQDEIHQPAKQRNASVSIATVEEGEVQKESESYK